jgi:acyl transferase domain-containing protein/NADPH:quinone reductase-like Zn-dependent oxidoreductase/acyl carrier protein/NADP-dependent 3-hydroxy acid dehydrogenase YdfG
LKDPLDIAIIGRSCRMPGASSVAELWHLLRTGSCAVTEIPAERWSLERLYHPRLNERGRSYTWSCGVLDDIWGFDPSVFSLSPREAEQMDPQQRLMLELTFEALEDAGIKPSVLAGSETGVFVGASALDYGNLRILDSAGADPYFATGNTLSIVSNRVSYAFDLHGPSFTVDTACSSALVALNEAVLALRSGRIDTAIVGGVNVLASPFGFLSFSQASMLSRIGLCQAFSAKADGYVRAEGGVVLVLRNRAAAAAAGDRIHAMIHATDVNSDGRTSGISLPSKVHQAALLSRIYSDYAIDPERLAFVEAHGTGTRVGDPIEAGALGEVLGRRRGKPLPIGSIKTNVGHMEPASGLAGVLKAMLALEHDEVPASLHFEDPNPEIDFAGLNLDVCSRSRPLARGVERLAGINSFGFGGTNAHVVIADAPSADAPSAMATAAATRAPSYLVLSAQSQAALAALATDYAARLRRADHAEVAEIVAAAGHRRERMAERLVIPYETPEAVCEALEAAGDDSADRARLTYGTAVDRAAPVAFVYAGNGSQWAGMGVAAYELSQAFRHCFDKVSAAFETLAGWSLTKALRSGDLEAQLRLATVAQPLLFAVQSAATFALRSKGLEPAFVLGHSVGEVAAAEAAGILDLEAAVRVVHFRSLHQELTYGHGGMSALIGPRDAAEHIIAKLPRLEIAAVNSPRAFTIAGPDEDLEQMQALARAHGARVRGLDLAYPFHSALMGPVKAPLLHDLAGLPLHEATATFVSTVFAAPTDGAELDATYWWRNVREPVRFAEAVTEAARLGAKVFVEIAPRPTLLSHINDTVAASGHAIASFCVLPRGDQAEDPIVTAVATALARGAAVDSEKVLGDDPGPRVALPHYPWQRKPYRLPETVEAAGMIRPSSWHPLIGARSGPDRLEWHSVLDTALVPALADHCIDGQVILPGAAFVEMALAVARDWLQSSMARIADLEILQPMRLGPDESREVVCRVTAQTGLIEITSRRRMTDTPWLVHATAKIIKDAAGLDAPPAYVEPGTFVDAAHVYAEAVRNSLGFGPAFRQLARAGRIGRNRILVDLVATAADTAHGLDPARLDSCFHGLILIFSDESAPSRGVPYIPVRFGSVRLVAPGAVIARAVIDVKRHDQRAIIADFTLLDPAGATIATLHEIRYQALRAGRPHALAEASIVQRSKLACEPTAAHGSPALPVSALRSMARKLRLTTIDAGVSDDVILLEGWATSLALRTARALATDATVSIEDLVASGRLPAAAKTWLETLLVALERSGLAQSAGGSWHIDRDTTLPDPKLILQSFAADHQQFAAELLLAAAAGAAIEALCAGDLATFMVPFVGSALDAFELGGCQARGSAAALTRLLEDSHTAWPKDRALRILQIGYGPLTARAIALAQSRDAQLTILDPERRRLERARLAFEAHREVAYVDKLADLPQGAFDLVIAAEGLHRLAHDPMAWPKLRQAMASEAVFAVVEPLPSLFRDLVLGLDAARSSRADGAAVPSEAAWAESMKVLGLDDVTIEPIKTDAGVALLLTGAAAVVGRRWSGTGGVLIVGDGDARGTETTSSFATLLASSGLHVSIVLDSELTEEHLGESPEIMVFFSASSRDHRAAVERLAETCFKLTRCIARLGNRKATVWIVMTSATSAEADSAGNVAAGVWTFTRVLANELQNLDIRRVDVAAGLSSPALAERLRELVLSGTAETEIILGEASTAVTRFGVLDPALSGEQSPAEAASLERCDGSGMERFRWAASKRRPPERGEVEIAVAATGVNFRDVMWGLGLLPDEILENGFAGPTLGLECAGTVVGVGSGVRSVKAGDRVIAFAKGAFATHVTVPQVAVAPLPSGIPEDAAATIPVAFLTAFYGLVVCGRLGRGEWVLIHGGAGGVGLAALQIARWRGARVIATAGTSEKRALLRTLGAEHVFDSRSGAFVDAVRAVTGQGVSVVLNSLSGEAMERSISVLRPFGRFIELGKRDYVTNTQIGLRPFRRNLAYFGVDLDQLLLEDPATSKKLLQVVVGLFHRKILTPLPYRSFDAHDIGDAFHLMQQSGHIGKLVIRPPAPGVIKRQSQAAFTAASDKAHLVTGGLGGFGLETARFLADHGARHIVLTGRGGASRPEARALVSDLEAKGIRVVVEALDVTDKVAMQRLFSRFGDDLPPLAGVMHAAMVLEDAAIANLEPAQFARVLNPKVAGAELLDQLTGALRLDYFVLFSSATTMIGNPGQAAYVAANGFLEGLARRRRRRGLPALAVAWGAIGDVGVLARSRATQEALERRTGVTAMMARDALTLMAAFLAKPQATDHDGVIVIAPVDWAVASEQLAALRSPTYANLARRGATKSSERAKIDVTELLAQGSLESVRKIVSDLIVEEIGRVLRLPREDVSRGKPLSEIGLDSLMAVELALGLEKRLGLKSALAAAVSTFTVGEFADHVISLATGATTNDDQLARSVAERHLGATSEAEGIAAASALAKEKSKGLKDILQ